jgi:hypothetical protein
MVLRPTLRTAVKLLLVARDMRVGKAIRTGTPSAGDCFTNRAGFSISGRLGYFGSTLGLPTVGQNLLMASRTAEGLIILMPAEYARRARDNRITYTTAGPSSFFIVTPRLPLDDRQQAERLSGEVNPIRAPTAGTALCGMPTTEVLTRHGYNGSTVTRTHPVPDSVARLAPFIP